MSDLYYVEIVSVTAGLDLGEATNRAAALGVNVKRATKILKASSGPYAICEVRIAKDHPDADPLDELTPGFLHLLLNDIVPAVERGTPPDIARAYAQRKQTSFEKTGCVYRVNEQSPAQLRMTILCPEDGAPSLDAAYTSTAWVPDRQWFEDHVPRADLRWYPAPGLAGGVGKVVTCRPFGKVKKSLTVKGFASIGGDVYAVANEGGHVAKIDGKTATKLGKPDKSDNNRVVVAIHASDDALWIQWEDGGWTRVDPKSGARSAGSFELEQRSGSAETVEIAGTRYCLQPTPDPETFSFATDDAWYLYHAPTDSLPMRLGSVGPIAWVVIRKRPTLFKGGSWSTTIAFDAL